MKLRIFQLMLSMLLIFAMLPSITSAAAEDKTTFTLSSSNTQPKAGEEVMVTIDGRNAQDIYGFEIRVSYDPKVLSFQQASTKLEGFSVPAMNENGTITFAHTKIGNTKGESGNVRLASLRFKALSPNDAAIKLTRVKMVDSIGGSTIAEPGSSLKLQILNPTSYSDIKGHWAEQDIVRATEMGWVNGYPDGRFEPQQEVNRAQFTTMLSRALALSSESDLAKTFKDYEQIPEYARSHVSQAVAAGWVKGYDDATFRASRSITRSEITVMLMRVLGYDDNKAAYSPLSYKDSDQVPDWAYPAVAAASELGLVKGRSDNQFAPGGYTTRAEAVTLIMRILDSTASDE